MVVDTSAIVAILFGEPEAEAFAEAIELDAVRPMSAASVLEATIVIESELAIPVRVSSTCSSIRLASRSCHSHPIIWPQPATPSGSSARADMPPPSTSATVSAMR